MGDDDYSDVVRLLILTGARPDEIGSLARGEINIARKQIEIPGSRTKGGVDHVIPLARGGTHSNDNIRPAHAKCNLRKSSKLLEDLTSVA